MSTTSSTSPAPLPYASPKPRGSRFNWRLPAFLDVDLKALGNFPFDQNNGSINDIPPAFRALEGKKVLLDGFMYSPRNAGDKGHEFQLVYNVTKCCFSGPPQVQERVYGYVHSGDVQ